MAQDIDVNKLLASEIIKPAAIGKMLYPGTKTYKQKFYQKMKGIYGSGNSFTNEELEKIRTIWDQLKKEVEG